MSCAGSAISRARQKIWALLRNESQAVFGYLRLIEAISPQQYFADLVIEEILIAELKACRALVRSTLLKSWGSLYFP
jgi:hypothetical protein